MFAAAFVFEQQTDDALKFVGYDSAFISSFPFIRSQYLIASERLKEINIAHFHLLDVAVWWVIIVTGMRFLTTTIFLKQYDDRYRYVQQTLSRGYERYGWIMYFGGVIIVVAPFVVSNMQLAINSPELFLFVKYFPRVYFFMILFVYCYCWFFFAEFGLFFIWKMCREKRPGVVLWQDESQRGDASHG